MPTTNTDALAAATRVASLQYGVLSTAQLHQLGCSRRQVARRLASGEWVAAHPGVLVVAGTTPSFEADLKAATLAAGGTVASHRSAARLFGLDGFAEAPVEVLVPRPRHPRLTGVVVHTTGHLPPEHVTVHRGIPVTTVPRTLCDLGAVVEPDRLERALDDAIRRGLALMDLQRLALDTGDVAGVRALQRLLARPERAGRVPDSIFERLVERLLAAAALPPFVRQHEVRDERGRLVARVDLAFPVVQVAVEAHSDAWHHGARRGERDRRRDRALAALGWERIYLSWAETHHPEEAVASVLTVCRRRAVERGVDPRTWTPGPSGRR